MRTKAFRPLAKEELRETIAKLGEVHKQWLNNIHIDIEEYNDTVDYALIGGYLEALQNTGLINAVERVSLLHHYGQAHED